MTWIRRLVRELHRRSVWQILGIYAVGSWAVLQVVDLLTEHLTLPAWTVPLAFILLLIGLPVVLATAFLQEGVGPRASAALGNDARANVGAPPAGVAHRVFTWRNALLGGVGAFALWGVVAAAYVGTGRLNSGAAGDTRTTLAVLPFENQGDPADAYFADGMADDVRSRLAAVPGLRVIAHASVERYRDSAEPAEAIARQLGATHLLTARVRWDRSTAGPSRVRVTPELVEVGADGRATVKWQTTVDAVLQDVFRVQSEIATRVSRGLDIVFGQQDSARVAARPTENLAAYDAYLRGRELTRMSSAGDMVARRRAIAYFRQATALDSSFAAAWSALSTELSIVFNNSTQSRDMAEEALAAARRALALAPTKPEPHAALSTYYRVAELDATRAAAAANDALRYAPNDAGILVSAAGAELALGRPDRALEHLDLARQLDPLSTRVADRRQITLLTLRRYEDALADAARILAIEPTNLDASQNAVMAHIGRGDLPAARTLLRDVSGRIAPEALVAYFGMYWDLYWILDDAQQRMLLTLPAAAFDGNRAAWAVVRAQLYHHRGDVGASRQWADTAAAIYGPQVREDPGNGALAIYHGVALAYLGRTAEAVAESKRGAALVPVEQDAHMGAYYSHQLARIYLLAGVPEQALDVLEPLVLGAPYFLSPGWLRVDPNFDPIRAHPRFRRLAEIP